MGTMRKQIMGLAFCIAAIAPTAVAQTTNTFPASGKVGIGTTAPSDPLSVTPPTPYSTTGTASQSVSTVTVSGSTFVPAMVGAQLVFANGVSAGTITGYTSSTQVTVSTSQTVASQAYSISYIGLQVASNGNVGIGITAPANLLDVELSQDDSTAPLGLLKLGNTYVGPGDNNAYTFSMGKQPFFYGQYKGLILSGGSSGSNLSFLDNMGLGAADITFASNTSQGHNITVEAFPSQTADVFDVLGAAGGTPLFNVQPSGNVTVIGNLSTNGNISTNTIVASGGVVGSSVTSSTTVTAASLSVGIGATTPRTTLDVNGTIATQRLVEIYGSNDVAAGASVTVTGGILSGYGGPTTRGNQSWWQTTAVGQQMTVDLGGPVLQINGISFSTFYAGSAWYIPAGYTIAYSTDNVTYTPLVSVTGNARPDVYNSFNIITARYIRLTVTAFQSGNSIANISGLRIYSLQGSAMSGEELWSVLPGINSNNVVLTTNGSVGIGTTNPGASDAAGKLEVNGDIVLTNQANGGGSGKIVFADGTIQSSAYTGIQCTGADYAEAVDVTGDRTKYEPGDLLVIDPSTPGKFLKSAEAYSTLVAGIYSTKPGFVGRLQPATPETSITEVPMAMVGRVPTKVTTENGPIKVGDLLVASSTPGHAMKGTDRSLLTGAVIGKALGSLDSGTGVIEVLVTLQ